MREIEGEPVTTGANRRHSAARNSGGTPSFSPEDVIDRLSWIKNRFAYRVCHQPVKEEIARIAEGSRVQFLSKNGF